MLKMNKDLDEPLIGGEQQLTINEAKLHQEDDDDNFHAVVNERMPGAEAQQATETATSVAMALGQALVGGGGEGTEEQQLFTAREDEQHLTEAQATVRSGFEDNQADIVGSFFSTLRSTQETSNGETPLSGTEKMNGKDYIEGCIRSQESNYHKKLPFERSQYHQCIPNPKQEDQLITVQLCKPVIEGIPVSSDDHQFYFNQNQNLNENQTMRFQRFKLVPPNVVSDDEEEGEGEQESEGQGSDDGDLMHQGSNILKNHSKNTSHYSLDLQNMLQPSPRNFAMSPRNVIVADPRLYEADALNERLDPLAGPQAEHYAEIETCPNLQSEICNKFLDCQEVAIIAFWVLNEDIDKFECQRHFFVPNPKKRMVKDVGGTQLYQVLYTSEETKDVFLFFEGPELEIDEDIAHVQDQREQLLHCTFLKLAIDKEKVEECDLQGIMCSTQMNKHCERTQKIPKDSILSYFIVDLHNTAFSDQRQMPNPTVINNVYDKGHHGYKGGKTIVFTAYLLEEEQDGEMYVSYSWYPSIYFYDLESHKINWKIQGAEIFIKITDKQTALVFSNRMWSKIDQDTYDEKKENDTEFSRFNDFSSSILEIDYGQGVVLQDFSAAALEEERFKMQAPDIVVVTKYRLKFGLNRTLEMTEKCNIVEARMHNLNKRVTLLYPGLCSFTFILSEPMPLTEKSEWSFKYKHQNSFCMQIAFDPNKPEAWGCGFDEHQNKFEMKLQMDRKDSSRYHWDALINTEEGAEQLWIEGLAFKKAQGKIQLEAKWPLGDESEDKKEYTLAGSFNCKKNRKRNLAFTIIENDGGDENEDEEGADKKERVFKGKVDQLFTSIKGTWHYKNQPNETRNFQMQLAETIQGNLTLTTTKNTDEKSVEELPIQVDFKKKMITSAEGQAKELNITATEARDSCDLCFFIFQPDVNYLTVEDPNCGLRTYVQAKMCVIGTEDDNSNGIGVVETSVVLYDVCENVRSNRQKNKELRKEISSGNVKGRGHKNKKKYMCEPKTNKHIKFYTSQCLVANQQRKDTRLWGMNASLVSTNGRYLSSLIFQNGDDPTLQISFVSAQMPKKEDIEETDEVVEQLDYPQSPTRQSWIVDYPLLAYKTMEPTNREIAIVHMSQNIPQRMIHLGKWEFVCFVNHTLMVEQKLFKMQKETNCNIMFLVRYKDDYRLMSFKSNPWLRFNTENVDGEYIDNDVFENSLFIFSGRLRFTPTHIHNDQGDRVRLCSNTNKYNRRFSSDKIQSVQLMTNSLGSVEQYMLIIQFNDCIVEASLNNRTFKVICEPEAMIRRHLVRGYNEKIFFAETSGNAEKIQMLEFHPSKPNKLTKKTIWQLTGSWIVAFEADGENIQNDMEEDCTQSIYVMDDQQKIHQIRNDDGVRFKVAQTFDFSQHRKLKEITELRDDDWAHVHVSQRTLSFGNYTYNLSSSMSESITVPNAYFGQEVKLNAGQSVVNHNTEDQNDSDDNYEQVPTDTSKWMIESVQMMGKTNNIIFLAQRNNSEFCFVVKPAPGSRRINIVAHQQEAEIEQMLFITNNHILIKLRGGQAVTIQANGCVIFQPNRIQGYLDQQSRVIGESAIQHGKKTILIEQKYGIENKKRYICLQFNNRGIAAEVGIYDEPVKQVATKLLNMLGIDPNEINRKSMFKKRQTRIQLNEAEEDQTRYVSECLKNGVQGLMKSVRSEEKPKTRVRFHKDFLVTQDGEVIKIAGFVTQSKTVRKKLDQQSREEQSRKDENKDFKKKRQHGDLLLKYFSVIKGKDTGERSMFNKDKKSEYKTLVFHVRNSEELTRLTRQTQFCIVGDFICIRHRNERNMHICRLKDKGVPFIPETDLFTNYTDDKISADAERKFKLLYMVPFVDKSDLATITITQVPKGYHSTIKNRDGLKLTYYDNLLQYTARNRALILDLDDKDKIQEVATLEGIDSMQDPDIMVPTGFNMFSCKSDKQDDEAQALLCKHNIISNETQSLLYQNRIQQLTDDTKKILNSGTIYRTYSEIDLLELKQISQTLTQNQKIAQIDQKTLLCTFNGHTTFSIFQENIEVYEQILAQMKDEKFEDEEDFDGQDVENSYLRRLYRILSLPTGDWLSSGKLINEAKKQKEKRGCCSKFNQALRTCLGLGNGQIDEYRSIGFKSVLQKSLHFKSSRFRENLMELAMMCAENEIQSFVLNLQDIEVLFASMTPEVVSFFENSFRKTHITRKIKNLQWRLGDNLEVIGATNSYLTDADANHAIQSKASSFENSKAMMQSRQVEVEQLSLDWLHSHYMGLEECGFRELVVALQKAPLDSLFSTELVISLVEHFWDTYYKQILLRCFLPFIIYFISTILYMSIFAVPGVVHDDDLFAKNFEITLRVLILIGVIFFGYMETVAFVRDGCDYFTDPFNYVDIFLQVMNLLVTMTVTFNPSGLGTQSFRYIATAIVICMWLKAFYWLRLWANTSFYIKLILETVYDIRYFLILFVFILMTFGNAFLILNEGQPETFIPQYFGNSFANIMFDQYLLSLGEFNGDGYMQPGAAVAPLIIFIVATFITQITFLNMLIAIMGDTFARVSEVRDQSALREKIEILADFVQIVPKQTVNDDKFLFRISPINNSTDEGASWEGSVTTLRRNIDGVKADLKVVLNKSMTKMSDEVAQVNRAVASLERRMNEQQSNSHQQAVRQTEQNERILAKLQEMEEAKGLAGGQPQFNADIPDDTVVEQMD